MAYRGKAPSFKTDVHRNPTRKWADAKSYSYEGDEWGGYDEFGEYGTYDDPPPLPKATGFRQRGQALPSVDTSAPRAASASTAQPARGRSDSFDAGDDTRSFSAGIAPPRDSSTGPQTSGASHQSSGSASPARFGIPGVTYNEESAQRSAQAKRNAPQDITGPAAPNYPASRGRNPQWSQSSSRVASSDRQTGTINQTTGSVTGPTQPIVHPQIPATSAQADASFPPRKSSLTTDRPTDFPEIAHVPPRDDPGSQQESAEPIAVASEQTDANGAKPFPFVRPADIYKRIQEEKAKERRSMDSNRSSAESLYRAARDDRAAMGTSQSRDRESSGSPARVGSTLQTVPERKSEYGLEGFIAPESQQAVETAPDSQETYPIASEAVDRPSTDSQITSSGESVSSTGQTGPVVALSLPQLGRFSGFGSDFWGISTSDQNALSSAPQGPTLTATAGESTTIPGPDSIPEQSESRVDSELKHQPSLGIRSAVEDAFMPQTPLSGPGSQRSKAETDMSGSSNTGEISPIMSRVPSAATAMRNAKARGEAVQTPPIIAEEPLEQSTGVPRPDSLDTITGPSISSIDGQSGVAPSAVTGRGLVVQTDGAPPKTAAAQVDYSGLGSNYTESPSNYRQMDILSQPQPSFAAEHASRDEEGGQERQSSTESTSTDATATQLPATMSPTKGRVKDLASQYDIMHSSRQNSFDSNSATSSRPISPANLLSSAEAAEPGLSTGGNLDGSTDAQQGFSSSEDSNHLGASELRPKLPGAWVSYSENSTSQSPSVPHGDNDTSSVTRAADVMDSSREVSTAPNESLHSEVPFPSQADSSASMTEDKGTFAIATEALSSTQQSDHLLSDKLSENLQPRPLSAPRSVSSIGEDQSPHLGVGSSSTRFGKRSPSPINTSVGGTGREVRETSGVSNMSWESSPEDTENDRIRKDIVRTLNVSQETGEATAMASSPLSADGASPNPSGDGNRESRVIPREYDSYWASTGSFTRSPGTVASVETLSNAPTSKPTESLSIQTQNLEGTRTSPVSAGGTTFAKPKAIKKRFSWEEDDDEDEDGNEPTQEASDHPEGLGISSPDRNIESSGFTETSPTGGAGQDELTSAYTVPEITFGEAERDLATGRDFQLSYPGDMQSSQTVVTSQEQGADDQGSVGLRMSTESNDVSSTGDYATTLTSPLQAPPAVQARLMPFKEIMALAHSSQRIQACIETRQGFAVMHTGLNDWLTYMMAGQPELLQAAASSPKATVNTTGIAGSMRTKLSPSVAKLMSPSGSQPYYQQYLDSAGPLPTVTTQPNASSSAGQADAGAKGRNTSAQMQGKGKEFLHSAGVLGGKASTGAKGLFAKGKSKFRASSGSDKDHPLLLLSRRSRRRKWSSSISPAAAPRRQGSSSSLQLPPRRAHDDQPPQTAAAAILTPTRPAATSTSPVSTPSLSAGPSVSNSSPSAIAMASNNNNRQQQYPTVRAVGDGAGPSPPSLSRAGYSPRNTWRSRHGGSADSTNWPLFPSDAQRTGPAAPYYYGNPVAAEDSESPRFPDVPRPMMMQRGGVRRASPNTNMTPPEKPRSPMRAGNESFHTAHESPPSHLHVTPANGRSSSAGRYGSRDVSLSEGYSSDSSTNNNPSAHRFPRKAVQDLSHRMETQNQRERAAAEEVLWRHQSSGGFPEFPGRELKGSNETDSRPESYEIFPRIPDLNEEIQVDTVDSRRLVATAMRNIYPESPLSVGPTQTTTPPYLNSTTGQEQDSYFKNRRAVGHSPLSSVQLAEPRGLDPNLANGDMRGPNRSINRESKELAVAPTDIHPAMRDNRSFASSISDERLDESDVRDERPPSVELGKLPPSVQRPYRRSITADDQPYINDYATESGNTYGTRSWEQQHQTNGYEARAPRVSSPTLGGSKPYTSNNVLGVANNFGSSPSSAPRSHTSSPIGIEGDRRSSGASRSPNMRPSKASIGSSNAHSPVTSARNSNRRESGASGASSNRYPSGGNGNAPNQGVFMNHRDRGTDPGNPNYSATSGTEALQETRQSTSHWPKMPTSNRNNSQEQNIPEPNAGAKASKRRSISPWRLSRRRSRGLSLQSDQHVTAPPVETAEPQLSPSKRIDWPLSRSKRRSGGSKDNLAAPAASFRGSSAPPIPPPQNNEREYELYRTNRGGYPPRTTRRSWAVDQGMEPPITPVPEGLPVPPKFYPDGEMQSGSSRNSSPLKKLRRRSRTAESLVTPPVISATEPDASSSTTGSSPWQKLRRRTRNGEDFQDESSPPAPPLKPVIDDGVYSGAWRNSNHTPRSVEANELHQTAPGSQSFAHRTGGRVDHPYQAPPSSFYGVQGYNRSVSALPSDREKWQPNVLYRDSGVEAWPPIHAVPNQAAQKSSMEPKTEPKTEPKKRRKSLFGIFSSSSKSDNEKDKEKHRWSRKSSKAENNDVPPMPNPATAAAAAATVNASRSRDRLAVPGTSQQRVSLSPGAQERGNRVSSATHSRESSGEQKSSRPSSSDTRGRPPIPKYTRGMPPPAMPSGPAPPSEFELAAKHTESYLKKREVSETRTPRTAVFSGAVNTNTNAAAAEAEPSPVRSRRNSLRSGSRAASRAASIQIPRNGSVPPAAADSPQSAAAVPESPRPSSTLNPGRRFSGPPLPPPLTVTPAPRLSISTGAPPLLPPPNLFARRNRASTASAPALSAVAAAAAMRGPPGGSVPGSPTKRTDFFVPSSPGVQARSASAVPASPTINWVPPEPGLRVGDEHRFAQRSPSPQRPSTSGGGGQLPPPALSRGGARPRWV